MPIKITDTMSDEEKAAAEAANKAELDGAGAGEGGEGNGEGGEGSSKEDDIDYDALIEEEKKKGKPDLKKAAESFKEREERRKKEEEEAAAAAAEDDKPVTRKELQAAQQKAAADARKEAQLERATEVAKSISGSDKEAELLVARWENRSFPEGTPLSEQIEEVYAGMHRKKLIGERDEALRALKNKGNVNRDGAPAHRDGQKPPQAKVNPSDKSGIEAAGFVMNTATRVYEKKLPNGDIYQYDPVANTTKMVKKSA